MKPLSHRLFFFLAVSLLLTYCAEEGTRVEYSEYQEVPRSNIVDDSNSFNSEWEKHMSDYEPEYVYMLELPFKTEQVYFENVDRVPTEIRGAFLISEENSEQIDFAIYNPLGTIVIRATSNQKVFRFTAQEVGLYKLVFNNKYKNTALRCTFTMNAGHNIMLKKDHLTVVEEKLEKILGFTQKFNLEMKLSRNIHEERYGR